MKTNRPFACFDNYSRIMCRSSQSFLAILLTFVCLVNLVESEYAVARNLRTGEELGAIRGSLMETRLGNSFHAFRGIPYAKPPINSLRFKVRLQSKCNSNS